MQLNEQHQRYWRKNMTMTLVLLLVWFVITFVMVWFAKCLTFTFFGWPLSFFWAAQGAPFIYVIMIAYYAKRMDALDIESHAIELNRSV